MLEVSVVMSVYNEKQSELEESIKSICNQTFKNFEFIIIVDNPNNIEAINLIKDLKSKDKRIKMFQNDVNIGLANSLNKAIRISKGKYIVRMDADDISIKNRIEKLYQKIKDNDDLDLIGSNSEIINEFGTVIGCLKVPNDYYNIKKMMRVRNCFIHPSVLFRKEQFLRVGGYRKLPCAQDYDLFLRMLNNGAKAINLKENLLKYRIRENSISSSKRLLQILISEYVKKINKKNSFEDFSEQKIAKIYEEYLKNNIEYSKIRNEVKNKKKIMKIIKILKAVIISKYYRILLKNIFLENLVKFF